MENKSTNARNAEAQAFAFTSIRSPDAEIAKRQMFQGAAQAFAFTTGKGGGAKIVRKPVLKGAKPHLHLGTKAILMFILLGDSPFTHAMQK